MNPQQMNGCSPASSCVGVAETAVGDPDSTLETKTAADADADAEIGPHSRIKEMEKKDQGINTDTAAADAAPTATASVATTKTTVSTATTATEDLPRLQMSKSPSEVNLSAIQEQVENPTPQRILPPADAVAGTRGDKICIVMVGLPARGKTFISRRLRQYLRFFHGAVCEVFNVGTYRRKRLGVNRMADFFDPSSKENAQLRFECSKEAMRDMKQWINDNAGSGTVAIFDATNGTRARRDWIVSELDDVVETRSKIIFVESVCKGMSLVEENIQKAKSKLPDYNGIEADAAIKDFRNRIAFYEQEYQTIEDENLSWVKVIDGGRALSMNRIHGFLPGRILHFLLNLHTNQQPIFLSRHGQSEYNQLGKIGGDSKLSSMGLAYAKRLGDWAADHIRKPGMEQTRLWTSTLKRTIETCSFIDHPLVGDWVSMRPREWHALDELYAGVFDGMTYKEIETHAPTEFEERQKNKLYYRYPRGESYIDVISRLDPIIHEIERCRDPILIVAHQGILRVIYAYFMGMNREDCPRLKVPLNYITTLRRGAYKCESERVNLLPQYEVNSNAPSH